MSENTAGKKDVEKKKSAELSDTLKKLDLSATEANNSGAVPKKKKPQKESKSRCLKRLSMTEDVQFMRNFDPDNSNREKKKIEQALKKDERVHDEHGKLLLNGKDLCDCLEEFCPGCHFPCPKCNSCKCGKVCRNNRKWSYEDVEIEGTGIIIKNKYFQK